MAVPLLFFFAALSVDRREEDHPLRYAHILWIVPLVLSALFLTNNLHQLAFRFIHEGSDTALHGPVYWSGAAWVAVIDLCAFGVLMRRCRLSASRRLWYVPFLAALPAVGLAVWYAADGWNAPMFFGLPLFQYQEVYSLLYVCVWEACIQIGLIPANSGYGSLFSRMELSAAILDADGAPVRRSGGLSFPFPELEALQVSRQPVSGGSVCWAVDLRRVFSLNEQLEEAARQTQHRNELLIREGQVKKEMAELETRNRLYEQVYELIRPKLEQIEALSAGDDAEFLGNLPRISLLTAYIKRRCNMELLSGGGTLPLAELAAALTESAGCMQLCGVETAVNVRGEGELPAAVVISAYEHVHALAEEALETLKAFLVRISAERADSLLEVRIMLKVEDLSWDFSSPVYGSNEAQPRIRVSKEGGDLVVLLRFPKGGAA
jgi:hypothetical protein